MGRRRWFDASDEVFFDEIESLTALGRSRLASGSVSGTVRVWNLDDGKVVRTLKHSSRVNSVCVTPDGKYVITGSESADGALCRWPLAKARWAQARRLFCQASRLLLWWLGRVLMPGSKLAKAAREFGEKQVGAVGAVGAEKPPVKRVRVE